MEAGSLTKVITLQEPISVSDGMGSSTITWVDWSNHSEWAALTLYALGDIVQPTTHNNFYYLNTRAGTTGAVHPIWPVVADGTVNDPDVDGAQWTCKSPTIRASIWPLKSNEKIESMQNQLTVTHRIRIRYLTGVLPSFRIKFGTRYFNITSMVNLREENKQWEFLADEVFGG